MSKEPSWTDAAIEVLENSNRPWLTVPEMIKEIRSTGIKQLNHCSHSQACRSLRGALRFHARKDNGMFARNEDPNITYALRKRLNVTKVLSTKHPTHVANGLPQVQPPPLHPSPPSSPPPSTLTVEIDPTQRPPRPLRRSDPLGNFCLPSPLQSILGPKRTLSVLSDSSVTSSQRPVRKVRQKSISKSEEEEGAGSHLPPPSTAIPPSLLEVLRLEEHHPIYAYLSDVMFVRCGVEGEPWMVQGSRTSVEQLEIAPGASNEEDTEEEEESEESGESDSEAVHLQPRPTTQLLVRRTPHYRRLPPDTPGEAVARGESSPVCSVGPSPNRRQSAPAGISSGWKSDILPQVASLFLPGSLLVSENLKTLLNPAAYEGLLDQQKRRLVALLPTVDRPEDLSVTDGCWTNELFGSAVREWQERLAVGAFTPEHRARVRAEEKRRGSLRTDNEWKQQYYEDYWGERCKDKVGPPCFPFYPACSSSLPEHHLRSLKAIQTSYSNTVHDVPPPPSPAKQKASPASTAASHAEAKPPTVPKLKNSFIPGKKTHLLSSKLKKVVKTSQQKTAIKRLGSGHVRKAHLLTPLPPKTPYHVLLVALMQGSQPRQHPSPDNYVAPPVHTHPVFHDHFALLSAEHVPQEFSPPITNLLVRLPRAMFSTCMQGRAATRDHCYSRHSQQTSLKLSVPRSLLRTTCVCSGAPLMFCSVCHALYHVSCTYRNLCPSCCRCQV